jgi:membrane protein implicated in regulation of membrane protease activity
MESSIFARPEMIWFIVGLVLFLAELVVPGFVIFFFGVGAWITALACLLFDPGTNLQIVIFAVTSLTALLALRRIIQKKFFYGDNDAADSVEDEFTGKEAVALTDFGKGEKGKVEFKGTSWSSESDHPIKTGQRVIIVEKDNFNLIVEPKNQ